MADADPGVTVDAVYHAIETQLRAQFPAFATIEFDRDDEDERIRTPAVLLRVTETDPAPDQDNGTGQWPVRLRIEAHVILANKEQAADREALKAALALGVFVNLRRWQGVRSDEAHVIGCEPDEFAPNLDRFRVWKVEWTQLFHLGVDVWNNDGAIPEAFYSWSPLIGSDNEREYAPAACECA